MIDTRKALRHLRGDETLAAIIERVGPFRLKPRAEGTHVEHVARSILYQQLSGKAASTIHGRLVELLGGAITPESLARVTDGEIRATGVSRQKLSYLRDLQDKAHALPLDRLETLPDDEVIEALTAVKGVGRWTAEMVLIFRLGRPDVLPVGDLGIQEAARRAYRMRQRPAPARLARLGARWAPFRSVASWYLWRSLDVVTPG